MRRAFAFVLTLGAALAFAPGDATEPRLAGADEVNRAVVVVDLGNGDVRSACVRFRQQSITGIDLLRAARMDPVVQTYSGQGGAVCKLCGVGCNAGSGCLTCQAPRYWQYWRSDGGTGTYTYSQTGAGSTAVTDGDVEGWSWSEDEDPPPFLTVAEACSGPNVYDHQPSSSATTTTSTSAAGPSPTSSASRPAASTPTSTPTRSASSPRPTTSPVVVAAPGSTVAGAPSTTTALPPPTSTTAAPASELASRATPPDGTARRDAPGPSLPGLVAFAAVLAVVLGWTARLRRARRRAHSP